MDNYTAKTKQERISRVIQSCTNALGNEELLALLAIRTYTAEKITEGLQKAERSQELYENHLKEYGESYEATDNYNSQKDFLTGEITVFRGISRVIFKDDKKAQKALNLNERMLRTLDGFPRQAEATLSNAIKDESIAARCGQFGFPIETLTELKSAVKSLPDLREIQEQEKSEAQISTIAWDEAMEEMDEWYLDFVEIARYALIRQPQLLELLGIVVPA